MMRFLPFFSSIGKEFLFNQEGFPLQLGRISSLCISHFPLDLGLLSLFAFVVCGSEVLS